MKTREASMAIFYNDKKELLLQKRGKYSKNGEEYAFFGGGKEAKETPSETLIREVREELNLELEITDCKFLGTFEKYYAERDYLAIRHFFLIYTEKQEEDFTVLEGEAAEYFSLENAQKQKLPSPIPEVFAKIEKEIA